MATFKPVIRTKRTDGRYLVYIRCTHNRKVEYIKTDMYITDKSIRKGEISDFDVLAKCVTQINDYNTRLNREDIKNWTVKNVVAFITTDSGDIPFYEFCDRFVNALINEGRDKSANNYATAIKSFKSFFGKSIMFQDIDTKGLSDWVKSLNKTARAKETYPKAIKAIFEAGCLEYNDYNKNIIRIPTQPFRALRIPKHDLPKPRAVDAEIIRKVCKVNAPTKQSRMAQEVAIIMIHLAGMNTVDIFNLTPSNFKNGKICYNRSKTKDSRQDKAYMEISVPDEVKRIIDLRKSESKLIDYGYKDDRGFNKYVNKGLSTICDLLGVERVNSYTFRHSWATIAQTKCGASTELVGFCLNHVSAHRTTEGYIQKDFTPIDEMNAKVVEYIFGDPEKKATP